MFITTPSRLQLFWKVPRFVILAFVITTALSTHLVASAHPHAFYESTDAAVLRPYAFDALSTDYSKPRNNAVKFQLVFTEAYNLPGYEEFYVCLKERPPNSTLLLPHCVSAFVLSDTQSPDTLDWLESGRVVFPEGTFKQALSDTSSQKTSEKMMVGFGLYHEQADHYRYSTEPLDPDLRWPLLEENEPLAIQKLISQWFGGLRWLPARIPEILPPLAHYLAVNPQLVRNDFSPETRIFYHCLPMFQSRRWEADAIVKGCLPTDINWRHTSTKLEISSDDAQVFALDSFIP